MGNSEGRFDSQSLQSYSPDLTQYFQRGELNMINGDSLHIWIRKDMHQSLLEYQFGLTKVNDAQRIKKSFGLRYRNEYLVSCQYIKSDRLQLANTITLTFRIFYERIIGNLSQFRQMSFADSLHFYYRAFRGFAELQKQFGCFRVSENMFHISQKGKLKIWCDENIVALAPKDCGTNEIGQKDMIYQIISLIDGNVDKREGRISVQQLLIPYRINRFSEAIQALDHLFSQHHFQICDKLQSLNIFNPEQLWNLLSKQIAQKQNSRIVKPKNGFRTNSLVNFTHESPKSHSKIIETEIKTNHSRQNSNKRYISICQETNDKFRQSQMSGHRSRNSSFEQKRGISIVGRQEINHSSQQKIINQGKQMNLLKPKDLPRTYSVPKTVINYQPQRSTIQKIEYHPVEIVSIPNQQQPKKFKAPIVNGHLQRPQSHIILQSPNNHLPQSPIAVVKQSHHIQQSCVPQWYRLTPQVQNKKLKKVGMNRPIIEQAYKNEKKIEDCPVDSKIICQQYVVNEGDIPITYKFNVISQQKKQMNDSLSLSQSKQNFQQKPVHIEQPKFDPKMTSKQQYLFTDPDLYSYITSHRKNVNEVYPSKAVETKRSNAKIEFREVESRYATIESMNNVELVDSLKVETQADFPKENDRSVRYKYAISRNISPALNQIHLNKTSNIRIIPETIDKLKIANRPIQEGFYFPTVTDISEQREEREQNNSFLPYSKPTQFKAELNTSSYDNYDINPPAAKYYQPKIDERLIADLLKMRNQRK